VNDTQLEAMVVRLYGDSSSFKSSMTEAVASSRGAASYIEQYTAKVEGFGTAISDFAANAASAMASLGLSRWIKEGISAWGEQAAATRKLNTIMEVNGTNVEGLAEDYDRFASQMERVTKMADEVVLGIVAQAESFGLTGEAAKKATQDAIGFAAINDGNAQSYLRFTAAMAKGDTRMMMRMSRMIPQLRGIRDETELVDKATRLSEAGFKLAQLSANGLGGQLAQLKNQYGNFMEDVGKYASEVFKPFVTMLKDVVMWMLSWDEGLKRIITYVAILGAGILALRPAIYTISLLSSLILNPMTILFGAAAVALSAYIVSLGDFKDVFEETKQQVIAFAIAYQDTIFLVGVGIAAILATIAAYKLFIFTISLANSILTFFKVYQIIGIALWLGWTAAVFVAKAALFLFNVQMAMWTSLLLGSGLASVVWTTGVTLAKIATWLWNAALTVTNVLLYGVAGGLIVLLSLLGTFTIGAIAFGAFAVAVAAVYSAIMATVMVGTELYDLIVNMPATANGPLNVITGIFGEWKTILLSIIKAAKSDMPLAMNILRAGFTLAWEQVKALWTPLGPYLRSALSTVVTYITTAFPEAFKKVMGEALLAIQLFTEGARLAAEQAAIRVMWAGTGASRDRRLAAAQSESDYVTAIYRQNARLTGVMADDALATALSTARTGLSALEAAFHYEENDQIRAARAEVVRLQGLIRDTVEGDDEKKDPAKNLAKNMQAAAKAAHDFNAALWGSREALYRLEAYSALIAPTIGLVATAAPARGRGASSAFPIFDSGGAAPQVPSNSPAAGAPGSALNLGPTNEILIQIRDRLPLRQGPAVAEANLGGGG
jgi:hypothetical protein